MKPKFLSVIIPAYNAEKYLKQCVEKLQRQTYKNLELIIVNDGSTDDTVNICDDLSNKFANVKVIKQVNQGPGKAREAGVRAAQGEYITFVDADDYLVDTAYEKIIAVMEHNLYDIVQFGYYTVDESGRILSENPMKEVEYAGSHETYEYFIKQKNGTNFSCNKVFKYTLFQNVNWPKLYYSEDYFMLAQLYANASKVITIADVFYYYVQFSDSACNQPFSLKKLDQIEAGKFVVEFTRNKFPDLVPQALFYIVTNCARMAEKVYFSDFQNKKTIIKEMKQEFRKYYQEMQDELKRQKKSMDLDKMTRVFAVSPDLALKLKKVQRIGRKSH